MALIKKQAKLNDFLVVSTHDLKPNKPKLQDFCKDTKSLYVAKLKNDFFTTTDYDYVYAYHAEKVRRRFKVVKTFYKTGPNAGKLKSSEAVKTVVGGWKMRVFKFPIDQVAALNQYPRHFDVVLKSAF